MKLAPITLAQETAIIHLREQEPAGCVSRDPAGRPIWVGAAGIVLAHTLTDLGNHLLAADAAARADYRK